MVRQWNAYREDGGDEVTEQSEMQKVVTALTLAEMAEKRGESTELLKGLSWSSEVAVAFLIRTKEPSLSKGNSAKRSGDWIGLKKVFGAK